MTQQTASVKIFSPFLKNKTKNHSFDLRQHCNLDYVKYIVLHLTPNVFLHLVTTRISYNPFFIRAKM